jgi:hypothetical protein
MTKDDAIALLLADQYDIAKLDPDRKRRALLVLNEAVYEIDKAEISRDATLSGARGTVAEKAGVMDADALRLMAHVAALVSTKVDQAEARYQETRERLGDRPGLALASSAQLTGTTLVS